MLHRKATRRLPSVPCQVSVQCRARRTSSTKPSSFFLLLTSDSRTAPSTSAQVLPAGPAFISQARRVLNQRSFADEDRLLAEDAAKNGNQVVEEDDADAGLGDEQEDKQLLQLDPKLWKVRLLEAPHSLSFRAHNMALRFFAGSRSLRCPRFAITPLQSYRRAN